MLPTITTSGLATTARPYFLYLTISRAWFWQDWEIFLPYRQCLEVRGRTIVHVTLPLLVFQPTFGTEIQVFKKSLNQVLLLAVTGYGRCKSRYFKCLCHTGRSKSRCFTCFVKQVGESPGVSLVFVTQVGHSPGVSRVLSHM